MTIQIPEIKLNDGATIPQVGFGTLGIPPEREQTPENTAKTAAGVGLALEAGYRHIDTAQSYCNERGVGVAVAACGIPRDELYLTSKLANNNHRPEDVRRSYEETREKLGVEQLDLFLMHWPLPTRYGGDYVSTWEAMAQLVADGLVHSIGVSNFEPAHLERIIMETGVIPVVNQIQVNPQFLNESARRGTRDRGIVVEAWAPLGKGKFLQDPIIGAIAAEHERTAAQVILRWHVQQGHIVVPKSTNATRMRENLALFDFELTPSQIDSLSSLDQGESARIGEHPNDHDWVPAPGELYPPGLIAVMAQDQTTS